jgi:hypothetical protein
MDNEFCELGLDELDQVSGGNPVPGGTVSKDENGTTMNFGKIHIFIANDGSIATSGTETVTVAPHPA